MFEKHEDMMGKWGPEEAERIRAEVAEHQKAMHDVATDEGPDIFHHSKDNSAKEHRRLRDKVLEEEDALHDFDPIDDDEASAAEHKILVEKLEQAKRTLDDFEKKKIIF